METKKLKGQKMNETEIEQALEAILLNEDFYVAMEIQDIQKRKKVSANILRQCLNLEAELIVLPLIPHLYSVIARCYFDLENKEKAIAYSRDSLYLGELDAYEIVEDNFKTDQDTSNLHPLKTQRDLSMGFSDIDKAIQLQERIIKVTPYKEDEKNMMIELKKIKKIMANRQDNTHGKKYDELCEEVEWQTPMKKFTTVDEVREEEARRKTMLSKRK